MVNVNASTKGVVATTSNKNTKDEVTIMKTYFIMKQNLKKRDLKKKKKNNSPLTITNELCVLVTFFIISNLA
jgi:hypothetical protein